MTDLEKYDRAIQQYISSICKRIVYAPTDRAMYTLTKKKPEYKDKIPFPFLSFYRDSEMPIDATRYGSAAIRADFTRLTSTQTGDRTARYVHSIPVTLGYQVDIWATKATDVLELSQQLLLKLTVTDPVLYVPINPDDEDGRFHFQDVNWVDNSDIESEESVGRLYRHTFSFNIDARIKAHRDTKTTMFMCEDVAIDHSDSIYE